MIGKLSPSSTEMGNFLEKRKFCGLDDGLANSKQLKQVVITSIKYKYINVNVTFHNIFLPIYRCR